MRYTVKHMVHTCEFPVIHKTRARKYQVGVVALEARVENRAGRFMYQNN